MNNTSRPELPNILWSDTDEHHRSTLGVYGSPDGRTPHLDKLAEQSVVFDNAFCPMAVCAPTRASLLTGRLPSEGSVISNNSMDFTVPHRELGSYRAMRSWVPDLQAAGYRTVYVGKWHVTSEEDHPSDYGFEGPDWAGFGDNWKEQDYLNYRESLGPPREPQLTNRLEQLHPVPHEALAPLSARLEGPVESGLVAFTAEQTIARLRELASGRRRTGRPFLLRSESWGPHFPCLVPEP